MWIETSILAVVEGVTEFLPVSSTGHLILTKHLMGLTESESLDAFLVVVQAGAIFSVVTLYYKILKSWCESWLSIFIRRLQTPESASLRNQSFAFAMSILPFGVLGFLFKPFVKSLFSYKSVAVALIVGGVVILVVEKYLEKKVVHEKEINSLTFKSAFTIGIGQCLALWPGFSRSAATILMSRTLGFSRSASAEISFLIGLPTLLGASLYEGVSSAKYLTGEWVWYLISGIFLSWLTALVCIKLFVSFLKKYSLGIFAYYRIVVGILILVFFNQ
jgi:undecaprenyl-diphosphatase